MTPKPLSRDSIFKFTLFAAITLTALGIYSVYRYRPPASKISDVIPKTTSIKIESPSVLFSTAVFLNRNKTFVSLPYKVGSNPHTMWLTLQTPSGIPTITRLVYHPTIANIAWTYVEDNGLRLYQKNKTYRSLTDFIANPPTSKSILADPHLLTTPSLNKLKANALPDDSTQIDLSKVDYILTTYTDSRQTSDFSFYETTLDATEAFVTKENKLNWLINIPSASSDNPLYIGDIHVDYRQY